MTSVARTLIPTGPWTVDDLDQFPEGTGVRYELIDGALLVSAEPSLQHQRVAKLLEVRSPSTRAVDLTLKRQVIQDAGVPSYWLVDPDALTVRVLEIENGEYAEKGTASLGSPLELSRPWPMTVDAASLAP